MVSRPSATRKPGSIRVRSDRRPGRRQQATLSKMHRLGHGMWPPQWRISYAERKLLEGMRAAGMVSLVAHSSGEQVYRINYVTPYESANE